MSSLGCGPKITVFDKAAIDEVRTVLVVPFLSPHEATAGPIVAGMVATRLRTQPPPKLEIVVPPALWRLRNDRGQPPGQLVSRQDALRMAEDARADAFLVGTVNYSINLVFASSLPAAIRNMKASEFKNKFATRHATAWVKVTLVSTKDDRDLYVHTGQAKGPDDSKLMAAALEAAVKPLQEHLAKRKKS
jgi:hypothetical protein